jgi:ornithine cyclodeaminase
VQIWNRTRDKAQALCAQLAEEFPGIQFTPTTELDDSVRAADLICSAIGCDQPIIRGEWLKAGSHLDLVGAYTSTMREADDECLRRGSLFVDARQTTLHHIGELMIPLASGAITEEDVLADFADLCQRRHPGRRNDDEITIFKNGGGGHLDLMCARLLHRHLQQP